MSDFNEIEGQPDEEREHESQPKGIELFLGEEDVAFLSSVGRELTEGWLKESCLLYRIDLSKTRVNFYGESKKKVYKEPVQIFGRLQIESKPLTQHVMGGILKREVGTLTASVYIQHLEEKGLIIKRDGQHIGIDLKVGDFIMFKGQYFEIKDDGFSQLNNEFSYGGDRRFAITITAIEVDEDKFKAR